LIQTLATAVGLQFPFITIIKNECHSNSNIIVNRLQGQKCCRESESESRSSSQAVKLPASAVYWLSVSDSVRWCRSRPPCSARQRTIHAETHQQGRQRVFPGAYL